MSPLNNSTPSPSDGEIPKLQAAIAQLNARVDALERQQNLAPPVPASSKGIGRLGLAIVNRVGALTLALGVIFFFKYASDNQWIGEQARVVLGLAAGLLLVAGSEWLRQRDRNESSLFANGVAGCGFAIIYASAYASFGYYHLISIPLAWACLIFISATTVLLSIYHTSPAIAALGFMGAIFTALLLHDNTTPWSVLFAYLLLIALCGIALALRQHWAVFLPIFALLVISAAAICFASSHPASFVVFSFLLAAFHFAASSRAGNNAYLTAHGFVLVGAMRLVDLLVKQHVPSADRFSTSSALESVFLALYGIAILIWGITRNSTANRLLAFVLLALVILKLYLWDIWQLNTVYRVSAFVLLGALLLGASYFYSRFRNRT